jgi:hypothetical protein
VSDLGLALQSSRRCEHGVHIRQPFALEFLPGRLKFVPHLGDSSGAEAELPGGVAGAIAQRQVPCDPPGPARQAGQPIGKVDPACDHMGGGGSLILNKDLAPSILFLDSLAAIYQSWNRLGSAYGTRISDLLNADNPPRTPAS